jgi:hypothetical protein
VNALESKVRELLFWAGRRLDEESGSEGQIGDNIDEAKKHRRLQETFTTTTITTTTTVNIIALPRPQSLRYAWRCHQMRGKADDAAVYEIEDVRGALNALCATNEARIEVPTGSLSAGLYVFTAIVEDKALPGVIGEANVTVDVTAEPWIALWPRGPDRWVKPHEDVFAEFWHLGGGSGTAGRSAECPAIPDGFDMIFLRGIIGQPPSEMRALGNISLYREERRFPVRGQFSRVMIFHANMSSKMLEPGFQYAFRMLATTYYPKEIEQFKLDLVASGEDYSNEIVKEMMKEKQIGKEKFFKKEILVNKPNVSGAYRVIDMPPPKR